MSKSIVNRVAIFSTGVALCLPIMSSAASAAPAPSRDPSGNNGTIKVDGIDYDDSPANEPHVGCSFQIDFFGFDLGDRADLRFFAQAPSGDGQLLHEDLNVLVSADAAGGSDDVDESLTYDVSSWDRSALTPSTQQGYHVKVEANVIGAPGGAKQKVFWIDCPPLEVVAPVDVVALDEAVSSVEVVSPVEVVPPLLIDDLVVAAEMLPEVSPAVIVDPEPPLVAEAAVGSKSALELPLLAPEAAVLAAEPGQPAPAVKAPSVEAQVLGMSFTKAAQPVQAEVLGVSSTQGSRLARTGVDSALLTLMAGLLLALGTLLTRMGRVSSTTRAVKK